MSLYARISANFIIFSLHLVSILVQAICVYNNYAENSLCYFGGKFFDTPDPALIIVGRKSINESEKLILSAGKHHYSKILTKFREEGQYLWICRNS